MDRCGYDFIIMMKGMKALVKDIVLKNKGTFEDRWKNTIAEYEASGMTVEMPLFKTDERNRYVHIYYNSYRAASEKADFIQKISEMEKN